MYDASFGGIYSPMTTKKGGWKGISLEVAQELFQPLGIVIERNLQEQNTIATHPKTQDIIRRPHTRSCVATVITNWLTLKT